MSKKLWLAFGGLMLLTMILGAGVINAVRLVNQQTGPLVSDSMPGMDTLAMAEVDCQRINALAMREIGAFDAAGMENFEASFDRTSSSLRNNLSRYGATGVGPQEKPLYDKVIAAMDDLAPAWKQLRQASRVEQGGAAWKVYNDVLLPRIEALSTALHEEYNFNKTHGDAYVVALQNAVSGAQTLAWALSVGALVIGIIVGAYLIRDIAGKLNPVITALSEGANQIEAMASQFSGNSRSLAQGATEQASSLEETSASASQISAMARQNSANSANSSKLMKEVGGKIGDANAKLDSLSAGMTEIESSNSQITSVIKLIGDIAFQTNILALNAAVEAARAGENGMGFAVVAEEVRSLAQRCATATGDISSVIERCVQSSRNGKVLLGGLSGVMREVTGSTSEAGRLLDALQLGGNQQVNGVEQISKALTNIEQVTQQVAASAEQSASASTELDRQSKTVSAIVAELSTLVKGSQSIVAAGR